jgi:hypothetical protein
MVVAGLLGFVAVLTMLLALALLAKVWTFEVAYLRIAWLPLAALAVQGILWKPMLGQFSYFAVAFPVLTAICSLLLLVVGFTLYLSGSGDTVSRPAILRATLVAAVPALLLAAYVVYGLLTAILVDR